MEDGVCVRVDAVTRGPCVRAFHVTSLAHVRVVDAVRCLVAGQRFVQVQVQVQV
jgi:hypothetical protein